MSYTIQYGTSGKLEENWLLQQKKKRGNYAKRILFCVLGAAALISLKSKAVQDFLIPGDPEVTRAAFVQFTDDLQNGEQFRDAVYTFCREIIDHADIGE